MGNAKLTTTSSRARKPIKLSIRKKILFSAILTLLFFVSLECILALVGLSPQSNSADPFVGFSECLPLMELSTDENGEPVLSTAKNKLHWFNAQSFPKRKNHQTKRIFCMGGSTTYGHPYWDSTSFSGWLREYLPAVDPSHEWEVINAGGISYASYRVATLMEELAQYEPDLFVVYSVHNEFLERRTYRDLFESSSLQLRLQALLAQTRTWELANLILAKARPIANNQVAVLNAEVDEMLNHTIGPVDYHRDEEWRGKVLQHYEANLRRMVSIARRVGAKIVFITPTANEKNCSPFKSERSSNLSPSELAQLLVFQQQLEDFEANAKEEDTIRLLEAMIHSDPRYAEYHYRLGQAYMAVDRHSDAMLAFSRALNEDVCPLRAVDETRAAIDRVARELHVPVVDFEHKLRQRCEVEFGHSIFGEEYFLDHVHPTTDVNRQLALWIIERLQTESFVRGERVMDMVLADKFAKIEEKVLSQIDEDAQAFALRNLAKVLHWAGKFEEAIPRARDVLKTIPTDLESRFLLAQCLSNLGKKNESLIEYERLFSTGLDYPKAYLPFSELLAEFGKFGQAKAYLMLAVLHEPKNARAFYLLGLVHLQLREYRFAVESLEESDRLVSKNPQTLFYLAQSLLGDGKIPQANIYFEKVLAMGVQAANIHYQYGLSLVESNEKNKAMEQFQKALELAPGWDEVKLKMDSLSSAR